MPYVLSWSTQDGEESVETEDLAQVWSLLETVRDGSPPTLFQVWRSGSERALGVGLGRGCTVITYQESNDPPYYISRGDDETPGVEWFQAGGEPSEFMRSNLVPTTVIRPTLQEFLERPGRPSTVRWEQL